MAESQETIEYDAELLGALDDALSEPRLAPYLAAAKGSHNLAIKTYLWNSRLSKAFLYPLNVAEVTTRNAMHRAFSEEFGGTGWILNPPFPLTPESEHSRQKALGRLSYQPAPDDLVAALTFDFWSNLFRREYRSLWARPGLLKKTFRNLPSHGDRNKIQLLVADINRLRNRIAHHEPIHRLNHRAELEKILGLIGLRSEAARNWARRCSTVMQVVRTPPTANSSLPGLPLASTNLREPLMLLENHSLLEALPAIASARPSIALVANDVEGAVAITPARILAFLAARGGDLGGILDLSELKIADVVAATPPILLTRLDRTATTGDALGAFFPSNTPQGERPQAVLVLNEGKIEGVILHPIVRYG